LTTATTPVRPSGLTSALASEWIKIRTVRSTVWIISATVIVTVGVSGLVAFLVSIATKTDKDRADIDPAAASLAGFALGVIAVVVLGVLVISAEYSSGMIRTSLTAVPNRSRLLVAKALTLTAVTLVTGEIASFASFEVSHLIYATKHINTSLTQPGVARAVVGAGLYLTLTALFSLGIATLLRSTAGAIATVLGLLFVLPIVSAFLPGSLGRTIQKFLPSNAGSAIMSTQTDPTEASPWLGLAAFTAYTTAILIASVIAFNKSDI
jgi:ABC-2 type transport system permease protein